MTKIKNTNEKKSEKKEKKNSDLTFFPTFFLLNPVLKLKTLQNLLKKVSKRIE